MYKFLTILLTTGLLLTSGCDCNNRTRATSTTQINSNSYLLNAKDFDLATAVALVKENKVDSAEALEKAINTQGGINNVDVDKDSQIDYLLVKENRSDSGGISLNIMAVPSGTKNTKEAVIIASISFKRTSSEVEVTGGYPDYVDGYQHHHYHYRHHGLTFGEAMFLGWMFSPRPMYNHPYVPSYYAPRPIYRGSTLSRTRTVYRTRIKVSPIRRTARPKNYAIKSARKVPSRFSKNLRRGGSGFTNRSRASRSYGIRSLSKSKSSGSAFRRLKPVKSWGSSSRSRSWGNSNRKSGGSSGRSRSWGSSSSSRSRSWGSSSRSRSFGSRRRCDVTFKKNIVPMNGALKKLSNIRGVYFTYKSNPRRQQVGVIAQDVIKVLPEAVTHDGKGYMVDYTAMIPLLIEAVKELKADNNKLCATCSH